MYKKILDKTNKKLDVQNYSEEFGVLIKLKASISLNDAAGTC